MIHFFLDDPLFITVFYVSFFLKTSSCSFKFLLLAIVKKEGTCKFAYEGKYRSFDWLLVDTTCVRIITWMWLRKLDVEVICPLIVLSHVLHFAETWPLELLSTEKQVSKIRGSDPFFLADGACWSFPRSDDSEGGLELDDFPLDVEAPLLTSDIMNFTWGQNINKD